MEKYEILNVVSGDVKVYTPSCPNCGKGVVFGDSAKTICKQCGAEVILVSTNTECSSAIVQKNETDEKIDRETHEIVEHKKLPLLTKFGILSAAFGVLLIIASAIFKNKGDIDGRFMPLIGIIDIYTGWGAVSFSRHLENKKTANDASTPVVDEIVETGTAIQKKLG